jgi:alkylation response protein AidB-like acyl-CoA dehydrogenase
VSDRRTLFTPDHDAFRSVVRRFVEKDIAPFHYEWEKAGGFPRDIWRKAGDLGLLCSDVPEAYGGAGAGWLYNVIVIEEFWRLGLSGPGGSFIVHSELVAPYLLNGGNEQLKQLWLPKMVRGEAIGALAMTEPTAGSDLQGIRTSAIRDGDDYVINGQKIFISNGQSCDFVVLACKTDPNAGAKGVSLFLVEADREGFRKGRKLDKIGLHAQDTSELFFSDVRVPAANLIGALNGGFKVLMSNLVQERLAQAVRSTTVCEAAIAWTVDYTRERKAFGQTVADFQNTQFVLADLDTRTTATRIYTDWCIQQHLEVGLDSVHAAKLKMISTELQGEVLDKCLQFFGGNGYMAEYPIARAWTDARMTRIAGGAIEVMKQIIARDLFSRGR